MTTKYIIANISLPLKINDDGTYVVMSENTEIKFSSYEGYISRGNDKTVVCNELSNLLSSLVPVSKSVLPSENIENITSSNVKKNKNNITFKNSTKKHYVASEFPFHVS
jgi:hypothetical protein